LPGFLRSFHTCAQLHKTRTSTEPALAPTFLAWTKTPRLTHPYVKSQSTTLKIEEPPKVTFVPSRQKPELYVAREHKPTGLRTLATAVLAGNFAELPTQTLNLLSIGYLLSRVVYNFVYIHDTTSKILGLRSLVWLVGIGQIITLYVKSGNALGRTL
jgi:hypothetical protein